MWCYLNLCVCLFTKIHVYIHYIISLSFRSRTWGSFEPLSGLSLPEFAPFTSVVRYYNLSLPTTLHRRRPGTAESSQFTEKNSKTSLILQPLVLGRTWLVSYYFCLLVILESENNETSVTWRKIILRNYDNCLIKNVRHNVHVLFEHNWCHERKIFSGLLKENLKWTFHYGLIDTFLY